MTIGKSRATRIGTESRAGLQDLGHPVLGQLLEQLGFDLPLLLDEKVELRVQMKCAPLARLRQLLEPLAASAYAVKRRAARGDPPGTVYRLQPGLDPHPVPHRGLMTAGQLPKAGVGLRGLEDPSVDRSAQKLLGSLVGVGLVALLPPALRDRGHDELVDMGLEDLVEPGALRALLEAQVLAPGDRADRFD